MKNLVFAILFLLIGCSHEVDESYIVEALMNGETVEVAGIDESLDIIKNNVITEGCFGYEWCVKMTGTKGRAIATPEDIYNYMEAGSEQYPGDITSVTYLNKNYYPYYADSDVSHMQLRGEVSTWGPGWFVLLMDWCGGPGFIYCVHEE